MALGFCSANLSIGVYSLTPEEVVSVVNNRVIGMLGKYFDEFLVHKDRRCVPESHCPLDSVYLTLSTETSSSWRP